MIRLWFLLAVALASVTPARAYDRPASVEVALADNFGPLSFVSELGDPRGYIRDLWELWALRTGVAVHFRAMDWPKGIDALKSGRIDILGAVPNGPDNDQTDYSDAPLASFDHHAFYDDAIAEVIDAESLQRYTVGVVEGGNCHRWLRRNRVFGIRPYASFAALVEGFQAGEIHVFCGGRINALGELRHHGLEGRAKMSPPLFAGGIHWATRSADADLHRLVAEGFAAISQQERDEISRRWRMAQWRTATYDAVLGGVSYPSLVLGAALIAMVAWHVAVRRRLSRQVSRLRDTETRFGAVLDALTEVAWIKDLDGRLLVASDALARQCGVETAAALIGRTDFDCLSRPQALRQRQLDTQALERLQPVVVEEKTELPDGGVQWFECTTAPFRDAGGRVVGTVGMRRDITARKRTEAALADTMASLRASESRYRDMIGTLPVGVFEIDRYGNVAFANDRAWAILGVAADRLAVQPWAGFIHANDRVAVVGALHRMMTRGEPLDAEFRVVSDRRAPTWVQALGARRSDAGGVIVSVLDISERRLAEETRRARAEEFRALVELSPDIVCRYDTSARRLYANPSFVSASGLTLEAVMGKTPSEICDDPALRAYEGLVRAVAESGQGAVHELAWTAGDGRQVISEMRLVPERGDDGAVVSVVAVGRDVTQLKRIEEELRSKSERLGAILANLPGNAFTVHYAADGNRHLVYSAFEREQAFFGMSAEECRALVHPDDHALLFDEVPARLRRHGFSEAKFRVLRGDGSQVWLHARERVRERAEDVLVVDGLVFDVTEEIEAKRRQEEIAQRLRTLLDNIPGIAYRKEYLPGDSRIVYTNAEVQSMLAGFTETESYGGRFAAIWHPDDHGILHAFDTAVRGGENARAAKVRFYHLDGTVHWGLIRERVVDRRDDVIVAEGLLIDITEEMDAKQALEQTAEELWRMAASQRTLLNNMPGIIFRMEYRADGEKCMLEHYGEPLVNVPESAQTAEGLRSIVHPDDVQDAYTNLAARLRADGKAEMRFRLIRPDGGVVWMHTREKVVEHIGDTMIVEGQACDITAEVLMRQELEESERQRRRAEARLQQGRRFEALGQFAGGIAHDFNNLLGAMLGYARFIEEDTSLDSDSHRHASRIVAAGNKGRAIVEQILNYSRRMDLALTRFTIGDLLPEVASFCSVNCPKTVRFETDLDLATLEIEADRVQLTRVLMNLCVNARDALGRGRGTIALGAHRNAPDPQVLRRLTERDGTEGPGEVEGWTDGDGYAWAVAGHIADHAPRVCLYVSDTGPGMDATLLEQAFTPFFSTKDRSRGAGLGLAVVHGIVVAHGGALVARSRQGEGTRFEIILPVSRSGAALPAPMPAEPGPAEAAAPRILLVEDNVDVLDALAEALRRLDYRVDAFAEPLAALEAFRASPDRWNAVITDQIMPKLRGIDLIQAIRDIRPDLPCLLCSGYAEELGPVESREAGVSEMLRKPVGLGELLEALERVLPMADTVA